MKLCVACSWPYSALATVAKVVYNDGFLDMNLIGFSNALFKFGRVSI